MQENNRTGFMTINRKLITIMTDVTTIDDLWLPVKSPVRTQRSLDVALAVASTQGRINSTAPSFKETNNLEVLLGRPSRMCSNKTYTIVKLTTTHLYAWLLSWQWNIGVWAQPCDLMYVMK